MAPINKVCVFGVGGVGGYFGGIMAAALERLKDDGYEIYFIARGAHLNAIQKEGLAVVTAEKTITGFPTLASDKTDDIPRPDLFLICVKSYDLKGAIMAIKPHVNENTILIPLLNGADIYQRIRSDLSRGIVLPACVYVGTHISSPGVIHQSGGDGKILFGNEPGRDNFSPNEVTDFFETVGIDFKWADNPFPAIWEKYMFIAAFGLVSANSSKTLGQIMKDAQLKSQTESIMTEIYMISKKMGIGLPEDIIEKSMAKADNFPFDTKTSYQRDIEQKGLLNEGDLYGGFITRQGQALEIATPMTESIYRDILKQTGAK